MGFKALWSNLALPGRGNLPVYATVPSTPTTSAAMLQDDFSESENGDCNVSIAYDNPSRRLRCPSLSRFLADFTLGFADGLTVPFALTAGLSSLGKTDTVIYAGMAEICAGSISMGIGGYLSARGDATAAQTSNSEAFQDTHEAGVDQEKASTSSTHAAVDDYLMPLCLPQHLLEAVRAHVHGEPAVAKALLQGLNDSASEEHRSSPILSGFSVSLGYLLGGLLPLFPYFFVGEIGAGVRWSFVICILSLFIFGFTKHYVLQEQPKDGPLSHLSDPRVRPWLVVKQSLWEGLQMVILGSIAAIAALLCVQAFEGYVS